VTAIAAIADPIIRTGDDRTTPRTQPVRMANYRSSARDPAAHSLGCSLTLRPNWRVGLTLGAFGGSLVFIFGQPFLLAARHSASAWVAFVLLTAFVLPGAALVVIGLHLVLRKWVFEKRVDALAIEARRWPLPPRRYGGRLEELARVETQNDREGDPVKVILPRMYADDIVIDSDNADRDCERLRSFLGVEGA
jgi:hypothetical protein